MNSVSDFVLDFGHGLALVFGLDNILLVTLINLKIPQQWPSQAHLTISPILYALLNFVFGQPGLTGAGVAVGGDDSNLAHHRTGAVVQGWQYGSYLAISTGASFCLEQLYVCLFQPLYSSL